MQQLYFIFLYKSKYFMLQGEVFLFFQECMTDFVLTISFYLAEITMALGHLHKEGIIYQ